MADQVDSAVDHLKANLDNVLHKALSTADPAFEEFNKFFQSKSTSRSLMTRGYGLYSIPESAKLEQGDFNDLFNSTEGTPGAKTEQASLRRDESFFAKENLDEYQKELIKIIETRRRSAKKSKNMPKNMHIIRLIRWIQVFGDKGVKVDIDRILRCVAINGNVDQFDYLLREEGANLARKDIFGRSVLFYAAVSRNSDILDIIAKNTNKDELEREINSLDVDDRSPLFYAVALLLFDNIETCLDLGAKSPEDLLRSTVPGMSTWKSTKPLDSLKQLDLLTTLYEGYTISDRWRSYFDLPVYLESFTVGERSIMKHLGVMSLQTMRSTPGYPPMWEKSTEECKAIGGLTWCHVPWTNGILSYAAFRAISRRIWRRKQKDYLQFKNKQIFVNSLHDSQAVPADGDLSCRRPMCLLESPFFIAIVFPCLVLQDMKSFKHRRQAFRELRRSTIEGFSKRMVQLERTLDEAYYPSLDCDVLSKRNEEQVVTRECRRRPDGSDVAGDSKPILMVSQFWIWKLGDHILSAYSFPGKYTENLYDFRLSKEGFFSTRTHRPNWRGEAHTWKAAHIGLPDMETDDPDLQIGLFLAHLVEKFGSVQANGTFQSPLDIFENGVVQVLSSVDRYMDRSTSAALPVIEKEKKFINDISDIRGELAMIEETLNEQKDILHDLITDRANRLGLWRKVRDAHDQIKSYLKRTKKIDRDAERVEKIIQDQLNLKRTHASMRDTRISVLLGTAVIGFSIITIIFTPLAFMATLFALPIDQFARNLNNQSSLGDKQTYSTAYIGKWFATAELTALVVTGLAVWVALKVLDIYGDEGMSWKDPKSLVVGFFKREKRKFAPQANNKYHAGETEQFDTQAPIMNGKLKSQRNPKTLWKSLKLNQAEKLPDLENRAQPDPT